MQEKIAELNLEKRKRLSAKIRIHEDLFPDGLGRIFCQHVPTQPSHTLGMPLAWRSSLPCKIKHQLTLADIHIPICREATAICLKNKMVTRGRKAYCAEDKNTKESLLMSCAEPFTKQDGRLVLSIQDDV